MRQRERPTVGEVGHGSRETMEVWWPIPVPERVREPVRFQELGFVENFGAETISSKLYYNLDNYFEYIIILNNTITSNNSVKSS